MNCSFLIIDYLTINLPCLIYMLVIILYACSRMSEPECLIMQFGLNCELVINKVKKKKRKYVARTLSNYFSNIRKLD
jgi:hypothetical protein